MKTHLHTFFGPFHGGRPALGLLILRLVVGYAFVLHGLPKIQNPFSWGDQMGIPPIFQALAALAEFGGGLALIFGFFHSLAALGIFITMVVAFLLVGKNSPFIAPPGKPSWELVGVFMATSLCLLLAGPGKYSIDALLFGRKTAVSSE